MSRACTIPRAHDPSVRKFLTVAGYRSCGYFQKAANVAAALEHLYASRVQVQILESPDRSAYKSWLASSLPKDRLGARAASHTSSPICWLGDASDDRAELEFIGGCDDFLEYARSNFLALPGSGRAAGGGAGAKATDAAAARDAAGDGGEYDYDLVVIGGGSGGLACSKEAAKLGANVAVLDFVKPSPQGTKWGLGGTCVNVGCIPKKLMHTASLLGEAHEDAKAFGWTFGKTAAGADAPTKAHNWAAMVGNVQDHIHKLNFGYRVDLRTKKVKYLNALGRLTGPNAIACTNKKGEVDEITARRIVVAVGGRPRPLTCPGAELCIDSDDIFSLRESPGPKVLVVGASYVALECAGFLTGLGLDVTVMVRSILLRGFDRDMSERIGKHMERTGTKFLRGKVPTSLAKGGDGRVTVQWDGGSDAYDSVFTAVGRNADTGGLGLERAGVQTDAKGKIPCTNEQSNVGNIYAIGDVVTGAPELTPVAIQAGRYLARRLFGGKQQPVKILQRTFVD